MPAHMHDRPPSSHDAEQTLLRSAGCIQGEVDLEIVCDLLYGYGVDAAEVVARRRRPITATASAATPASADLRHRSRARRRPGHGAPLAQGRRGALRLAWGELGRRPARARRGRRAAPGHVGLLARVARGRALPDHPWRVHLQRSALALKGLTYAPTGALLAAADDLASRDAGRRAQLGLPLPLDSRLEPCAVGDAHARVRPRGARLRRVRAQTSATSGATLQIIYGIGGSATCPRAPSTIWAGYERRKPVRIGNAAHSQRQNDVYGALIDSVYIHTKSATACPTGDGGGQERRRGRGGGSGASQTRGSGRPAASRSTTRPRRSCAGSRSTAARGSRAAQRRPSARSAGADIADEIKADVLANGGARGDVVRQHYGADRARRLCAPRAARSLPARRP